MDRLNQDEFVEKMGRIFKDAAQFLLEQGEEEGIEFKEVMFMYKTPSLEREEEVDTVGVVLHPNNMSLQDAVELNSEIMWPIVQEIELGNSNGHIELE